MRLNEPEETMAYLDGELPAERAAAAADHLAHCRDCQSIAADVQSVSRRLASWEVEAWEPVMGAALLTAMREREAVRVPPAKRLVWPWAVAVVAGVVLLLIVPNFRRSQQVRWGNPKASAMLASQPEPLPQTRDGRPVDDSVAATPLIVRSAQLVLTTRDFGKTREAFENVLQRHGGHIAQLNINSPPGGARTLQGSLRIPAAQLDATMAEIRNLGRVESESQGGEEVTQQYVDLEARLGNSRIAEQRLADLLRQRTGKISDVLEVEKEMSRVRGEIERMEAERKNLTDRISFATLNVTISEAYQAQLQVTPHSTPGRLRNAAVDGYRNAAEGAIGVAIFLLSYGPGLLVLAAVLFFPGRFVWRRYGRRWL